MTPLNTLKNWFQNGLKPTQEQFWAWMDSFRHKADKIPVGDIENLDQVLAQKADADSLDYKADLVDGKVPLGQMPFADDVIDVATFADLPRPGQKTKLYKTDDGKVYSWKESVNDYVLAGVDEARIAALESGKVNEPTADGSWVRQKLGSVFSWVNANDFGKNIANSFLTSVVNAGINLGAIWRIKTNGFNFNIEDLPSKSADATYNRALVVNPDGTVGKSDMKQIQKNAFLTYTAQEWLDHRTMANGGHTNATMSIGTVYPNMVKHGLDYIVIIIGGANLNMNPATSIVSLINTVTQEEIVIPNSNVNYAAVNSSELTFWFKPSDFVKGFFAVRLDNGFGMVTTAEINTIQITDNVNNVNMATLTWNKVVANAGNESNINVSGNMIQHIVTNANQTGNAEPFITSVMSNNVVPSGKNFSMKGVINTDCRIHNFNGITIGLANSDLPNSLLPFQIASVGTWLKGGDWFELKGIVNNSDIGIIGTAWLGQGAVIPVSIPFVMSKRGNLVYISLQWKDPLFNSVFNARTVISKTIDPETPLSLLIQGRRGSEGFTNTVSIEELYTN